jgi:transposase-like protein
VQKKDAIKAGRRRRWTAAQKQQWLERYAASGQTQASFCRAHGLVVPTFSAWRRRRARRADELIEVPAPLGAAATIQGAGGVSVAITPGTDVAWVVRLVRALQCGA